MSFIELLGPRGVPRLSEGIVFCKSDSWRGKGKHIDRGGEAVPPTRGLQCLSGIGSCPKIKETDTSRFLVTFEEGAVAAEVHSLYIR